MSRVPEKAEFRQANWNRSNQSIKVSFGTMALVSAVRVGSTSTLSGSFLWIVVKHSHVLHANIVRLQEGSGALHLVFFQLGKTD